MSFFLESYPKCNVQYKSVRPVFSWRDAWGAGCRVTIWRNVESIGVIIDRTVWCVLDVGEPLLTHYC